MKKILEQFIGQEVTIRSETETITCKLVAVDDLGVIVHRVGNAPARKGTLFYPWVALTNGLHLSDETVDVERAA